MSGEGLMRTVAAAFEQGDLRPLFDAIDDDIVWKSGAAAGQLRFGGSYQGRLGVVEVTSKIAAGYRFRRFVPREITCSGDVVWGLFDVEGNYIAPDENFHTGRPFKLEFAVRWRLRRQKIVEHQGFFDTATLLLLQERAPGLRK